MGRFDDVLDRATERLKIDPELRLEVRRELEHHFEDCAAEFTAAGISPDESTQKAIESFGDPAQLAQQLWDANRRRIPARKVVRFVGRFALAPAAAAISINVAWAALTSLALLLTVG